MSLVSGMYDARPDGDTSEIERKGKHYRPDIDEIFAQSVVLM